MKRLAEDTAAPAGVRAMIAAARADAPAPAALDRILARVEADATPPRGGAGHPLLLTVGGAVVVIAIAALIWPGQHDEVARAPQPASAAPGPPPAAAPGPRPAAAPPPVVVALPEDAAPASSPPVATTRRSAPPSPHPPATAPAPRPPTEVSLVEEARAALAGRDYRAALVAAGRHEELYPAGVLTEEREAIRVEALAGTGDTPAARDRLRDFLRRFPRSSYRRHLEEVLGR
jgi:hypothetical protein